MVIICICVRYASREEAATYAERSPTKGFRLLRLKSKSPAPVLSTRSLAMSVKEAPQKAKRVAVSDQDLSDALDDDGIADYVSVQERRSSARSNARRIRSVGIDMKSDGQQQGYRSITAQVTAPVSFAFSY